MGLIRTVQKEDNIFLVDTRTNEVIGSACAFKKGKSVLLRVEAADFIKFVPNQHLEEYIEQNTVNIPNDKLREEVLRHLS